jgi:hypothetical protein
MSIRSSDLSRNQTRWKFGETYFYANIPEEIQDLKVIEDAKCIVDFALPQRFGPWSTEYYSHLTREYVLNLILYFYRDHKHLPHGAICIVDHWYWKTTGVSNWSVFSARKRERNYDPGYWVYIPSLKEAKAKQVALKKQSGGTNE